jgi:hypothetical protein
MDDFSGLSAMNWAQDTLRLSKFGGFMGGGGRFRRPLRRHATWPPTTKFADGQWKYAEVFANQPPASAVLRHSSEPP